MNSRMRSLTIFAGLSLLFVAFLVLIAKPVPNVTPVLPYAAVAHNLPYFAYLRAMQWLFGLHAGVIMVANGLLMLASCMLVFRVGWGVSDPRHRLLGASVAMLAFEVNPLVIILPLTLGFLGGYLMVPLFLLIFINVMLSVDHWSAFMRAIVLAVVWSLFLWVHLPTAIIVLVAMIPWVIYNRRPMIALWTFLTVFLLGTFLFSIGWFIGCALAQRWSLMHEPINSIHAMWGYLQEGIAVAGNGGSEVFKDRIVRIAGWFSPFLLGFGLWIAGKTLVRMFRERRTAASDLASLISLVVLGVVLVSPGKDTLPGAWYLVMIAAAWSPLIAKEIALKENFFTRVSRATFLTGFVVCGVMLWVLRRDLSAVSLVPEAAVLLKLVVGVGTAGAVVYAASKKNPLPIEQRAHALISGATLAYFFVMDAWLLR